MNITQPTQVSSMSSNATANSASGFGSSGGSTNQQQDEAAKNKMKQQRILLLRHASKCPYGEISEGGNGQPCPTTPNCASMKKLWKHMTSCKEPLNKCPYAHCNSSKYVMNHYRRCSDPTCPCCEPVREIIRKQQAKKQANLQQQQQQQQHHATQLQGPVAPTPPSFNFDIEIPDPTPLDDINGRANFMAQNRLNGRGISHPSSGSVMGPQSMALQRPASLNSPASGMSRPNLGYQNSEQSQYSQSQQYSRQSNQQQRPTSTSSHHQISPQPLDSVAAMADAKKRKFDSISSSIAIPPSLPAELNALVAKYTISQLGSYLANLKSKMPSTHDQAQLMAKCLPVLEAVTNGHANSWVFMSPVDPVALQLPDYNNVVKHPMDLGTVGTKLRNRQYKSVEEFGADVRLTFDNAMLYNPDGSEVHNWAREMKEIFVQEYGKMLSSL